MHTTTADVCSDASLLAATLPALAAATKPVIASAVPNYAASQLTITGASFGTTAPKVVIGGHAATVVSSSATTVVVTLAYALNAWPTDGPSPAKYGR